MGYQYTPFISPEIPIYLINANKVDTKYLKLKNTDITFLYTEYQEFRRKNTLYPHFGKKIPNTLVKNTQDTVYPKPLAGPDY